MKLPPLHHLTITLLPGAIRLAGELTAEEGATLAQWFNTLPPQDASPKLELFDLEIVDGVAATHAVNIVRSLLHRYAEVTLEGAPQLLAHNLYRVGLLYDGAPLHLIATREEEPYG